MTPRYCPHHDLYSTAPYSSDTIPPAVNTGLSYSEGGDDWELDGLHLSAAGYRRLGKLLAPAVQAALSECAPPLDDGDLGSAAATAAAEAAAAKAGGNAEFQAQRWGAALQHYCDAIEREPLEEETAKTWCNVSATLVKVARSKTAPHQACLDDAAAAAAMGTELSPSWAKGWWRRGEVAKLQRRYDDAHAHFQSAAQLEPTSKPFAKAAAQLPAAMRAAAKKKRDQSTSKLDFSSMVKGAAEGVPGMRLWGSRMNDEPVLLDSSFQPVPIAELLQVPLMVKRLPWPAGTKQETCTDLSLIVRLMGDPQTGLAPPSWQYGSVLQGPAPPVLLARSDGKAFDTKAWSALDDFICGVYEDGSPGVVTPARFGLYVLGYHLQPVHDGYLELAYPPQTSVTLQDMDGVEAGRWMGEGENSKLIVYVANGDATLEGTVGLTTGEILEEGGERLVMVRPEKPPVLAVRPKHLQLARSL